MSSFQTQKLRTPPPKSNSPKLPAKVSVKNSSENGRWTATAGTAISLILGAESVSAPEISIESPYSPSYLHFQADGKLSVTGGTSLGESTTWEAVSQDGNTLLVSQIEDNVQYYYYKIEFVSDDEATISMMFDETVMSSNRYRRVKPEVPAEAKPAAPAAPVQNPAR